MRIFSFSLMGCFIFSLGTLANIGLPEVPEIKEVNLNAEHVFVPKGFDSNDNSEIVVTGWYPNPCHEWAHPVVHKKTGGIDIQLKALVKRGMDTVCIDMAVPYMESIKLGALHEGDIHLSVDSLQSSIPVAKANSSSIDDFIYAQVRHIRSQGKTLVLEMERPSDCIEFSEFKHISNGKDTCAVLPVMTKIKDVCPRQSEVFERVFTIPEDCLGAEKVLFHVRSLEGKAVNFLFKNR